MDNLKGGGSIVRRGYFSHPLSNNPLWITASGNILAGGNLCFRVFKLQLKVINFLLFAQCRVKIKLIKVTLPFVALYLFQNF